MGAAGGGGVQEIARLGKLTLPISPESLRRAFFFSSSSLWEIKSKGLAYQ